MDFKDVVNTRHSVRDFSDKNISEDSIRQIIKLAQRSPSWVNSQPWKVYVASGQALQSIKTLYIKNDAAQVKANPDFPVMHRDDWSQDTQANMKQWRHEIVHHFDNFDQAHEIMTAASNNLNYAPTILYLTMPKDSSLWSVFDMGSFGQTIMLAAKSLGIDSIPNYNSVRFPDILRRKLNIPNDETIVVGISLGYAKDTRINKYQSNREPLDKILKFNR